MLVLYFSLYIRVKNQFTPNIEQLFFLFIILFSTLKQSTIGTNHRRWSCNNTSCTLKIWRQNIQFDLFIHEIDWKKKRLTFQRLDQDNRTLSLPILRCPGGKHQKPKSESPRDPCKLTTAIPNYKTKATSRVYHKTPLAQFYGLLKFYYMIL